eukprot:351809-Chlamydomonas_euryale.AAC.1
MAAPRSGPVAAPQHQGQPTLRTEAAQKRPVAAAAAVGWRAEAFQAQKAQAALQRGAARCRRCHQARSRPGWPLRHRRLRACFRQRGPFRRTTETPAGRDAAVHARACLISFAQRVRPLCMHKQAPRMNERLTRQFCAEGPTAVHARARAMHA